VLPGDPTSGVPASLIGKGHHDASHGDPIVGAEVEVTGDGGEDALTPGGLRPVIDLDRPLQVARLPDEAVLVVDDDTVQDPGLQVSQEPLEGRTDDVLLERRDVVVLVVPRDLPAPELGKGLVVGRLASDASGILFLVI